MCYDEHIKISQQRKMTQEYRFVSCSMGGGRNRFSPVPPSRPNILLATLVVATLE